MQVVKEKPDGLRPKAVATKYRIIEIIDAMYRYTSEGEPIPQDWIEELEELSQWMRKKAEKPKKQWI